MLSQQEAVSRIKYNPFVTLTILRERAGSPSCGTLQEHLYEEILYSDTPHNTAEPAADCPATAAGTGGGMGNSESAHDRKKHARVRINTAPELLEQLKLPEGTRHRSSTADPTAGGGRTLVEKVSADSGLSSGSSGSPGRPAAAARHPAHQLPVAVTRTAIEFSKEAQGRHSYHNERELRKKFLKNTKAKGLSSSSIATRKTYVEDGYEIEVSTD